eukprot:GFUD01049853.1.p1 GENE.GFUD01049853.1~~GFUD01049853.1.p1  ORF type:complete len:197 (-),score=55.71 GFUD01049853.1:24-614(-)
MALLDILNWTCPTLTGGFFGAGLVFLVSNIYFSFLSVSAYFTLALVMFGLSSKLYVHLMGFLKKPCSDPLAEIERIDVNLPSEKVEETVKVVIESLNAGVTVIRSLLLVHNFANSVKFAAILYSITYIGAVCNTLTLLTLAWVAAFVIPIIYTQNQSKADELLTQAKTQYQALSSKLLSLVPGPNTAQPAQVSKEQ